MKRLFVGTLFPCLLFLVSQPSRAQAEKPLGVRILGNGTVVITEDCQELARISADIFTGASEGGIWVDNKTQGYWPFRGSGTRSPGQEFQDQTTVNGAMVDLKAKVEVQGSELRVRYSLIPRTEGEVIGVHARIYLAYAEWQGDPFQLNGTGGAVPAEHAADPSRWNLQMVEYAPDLSMGPSHAHPDLRLSLKAEGLGLTLFDNRHWTQDLVLVLNHNENWTQGWTWEARKEKKFDFTVSFNRDLFSGPGVETTCPPTPSPVVSTSPVSSHSTPNSSLLTPNWKLSLTPTPGKRILPTPTPIRMSCPPDPLDDFEDEGRNGGSALRTDLFGGGWSVVTDAKGSLLVDLRGPGSPGSQFGALVTGKGRWRQGEGSASLRATLRSDGGPRDLLAEGINAVQFYMKGDGNTYWFNLVGAGSEGSEIYSYSVTPPKGSWTRFSVPFKFMNRRSWWETQGGEEKYPDGSDVTAIEFRSENEGSFSFSVDDIAFYCNPAYPLPPRRVRKPKVPTVLPTDTPVPIPPTWTSVPTSTPNSSPPIPHHPPTLTPILPMKTWAEPKQRDGGSPVILPRADARNELDQLGTPVPPPKVPTARPTKRPALEPTVIPFRPKPIPTLSFRPIPRIVWTPVPTPKLPAFRLPTLTPVPVQRPAWLPPLDPSASVTFLAPPANIFVTFADGPGTYRLLVVDSAGRTLKTIFEERVVGKKDAWAYWDGKDKAGNDMAPGQYFVLLYKDGKALKSISMVRVAGE